MGQKITYGNRIFTQDDVKSGECHLANDLMSASLEMNTLDFEVESDDASLLAFTRNAPLTYYNDDQQVGIFFVQKIKRTAKARYSFTCTSAMGLLDETDHYGGIYTGQTVTEVVADICGSTPHYVKTNLQNIKLYGYLPIATRRENLSQVLFAIGATVKVDMNGYLRIEGLWDGVSAAIGGDRVFEGGSVESDTPVTRVIVTEHQYIKGAESKSLYEGTTSEGDIITFDAPMHDLVADGFRILESGVNYAKVSSGNGTLTGTAYVHNTREVSETVNQGDTENVKRVEEATLVSLANANAVAERLARYYAAREVIEADTVMNGESPGDVVTVAHPYGGTVQACIESADVALSGILRASTRYLEGYTPPAIGEVQYYDTVEEVLQSKAWVVPDNVTSIHVVLGGGGFGGHRGSDGAVGNEDGKECSRAYASYCLWGTGGSGGEKGSGGQRGLIFSADLAVIQGQVIGITIGAGGKGGDAAVPAGYTGGATIFGNLSSNSGAVPDESGYVDPFTGKIYAINGNAGIAGGKGTGGNGEDKDNAIEAVSITDDSGRTWSPGISHPEYVTYENPTRGTKIFASGGCGGGAAVGANGQDATEAVDTEKEGDRIFGGDSGNGANAVAPSEVPSVPGTGGYGGNGGGGGGGLCAYTTSYTHNNSFSKKYYAVRGNVGNGGRGSNGGVGANGFALIYYRVFQPSSSGKAIEREGRERFDKYGRRMVV